MINVVMMSEPLNHASNSAVRCGLERSPSVPLLLTLIILLRHQEPLGTLFSLRFTFSATLFKKGLIITDSGIFKQPGVVVLRLDFLGDSSEIAIGSMIDSEVCGTVC